MLMTRRLFGQTGLAATLFAGFPSLAIAQAEGALPPKSPMGVAATGLSAHLRGVDGVAKGLRDDSVAFLEYVRSLDDWYSWLAEANAVIERCVPIAAKYRIAIALENHKDRTLLEHVALLRRIDSEYLGSLIDPGNNMSFMETPDETVTALSPWVKATSLKDMGVAPDPDGFLLSEVPFDTGMTDQAKLFGIMKRANPRIFPTTELITRDPLKVPVRTDAYHSAFADRRPRVEKWLEMVNQRQTVLPVVTGLSPARQFQLEEDNNRAVFAWGLAKLA